MKTKNKILSPFDLLSLSLPDPNSGDNSKNGGSCITVRIKGTKGVDVRDRELVGKLIAYDEHLNLMMVECVETAYVLSESSIDQMKSKI